MKKYVPNMNQYLDLQHPEAECSCFADFGLEEDLLCDLCRQRLVQHRKKIKHKLRRETKKKFKDTWRDD